jgi:CPA1 family monovalent cation:H+ antiporter
MSGSFALGHTLFEFVFAGLAGVVIGIGVAWIARWALSATEDGFTQIGVTLLAPYIAWVCGELVDASAVLACVAGALYLRQSFSGAVSPATRLQARAVWDLLIFILNGVIFILIGLQLGALRDSVPAGQFVPVLVAGAWVSATAILVRFLWVPLAALIPRWLSGTLRERDPMPPWSGLFLISWTGMRGIVTLAAALALPLTTGSGAPFPFRSEIILISFTVILVTLVLQGLSLPPIIRWLRLEEEHELEGEERLARQHAATAALSRLDQVVTEGGQPQVQRPPGVAGVDRRRDVVGQPLQRRPGDVLPHRHAD